MLEILILLCVLCLLCYGFSLAISIRNVYLSKNSPSSGTNRFFYLNIPACASRSCDVLFLLVVVSIDRSYKDIVSTSVDTLLVSIRFLTLLLVLLACFSIGLFWLEVCESIGTTFRGYTPVNVIRKRNDRIILGVIISAVILVVILAILVVVISDTSFLVDFLGGFVYMLYLFGSILLAVLVCYGQRSLQRIQRETARESGLLGSRNEKQDNAVRLGRIATGIAILILFRMFAFFIADVIVRKPNEDEVVLIMLLFFIFTEGIPLLLLSIFVHAPSASKKKKKVFEMSSIK